MKSMHFCTDKLVDAINNSPDGTKIETIRTGFVPSMYSGDIINLKDKHQDNKVVAQGRIEYVLPIQYKEMRGVDHFKKFIPEIKRYKRKFHKDHWFFEILIKIIRE